MEPEGPVKATKTTIQATKTTIHIHRGGERTLGTLGGEHIWLI
jgi:hypothetical protein